MRPFIIETTTASFKWKCLTCGICLLDGPVIDVELIGAEIFSN